MKVISWSKIITKKNRIYFFSLWVHFIAPTEREKSVNHDEAHELEKWMCESQFNTQLLSGRGVQWSKQTDFADRWRANHYGWLRRGDRIPFLIQTIFCGAWQKSNISITSFKCHVNVGASLYSFAFCEIMKRALAAIVEDQRVRAGMRFFASKLRPKQLLMDRNAASCAI